MILFIFWFLNAFISFFQRRVGSIVKKAFVTNYIIFFICLYIKAFICQLTTYTIYEPNNSYPRAVLLEGNDVLVFSGKNSGYMIKYNSNVEVILERQQIFEYDSNADIKQLKGSDKRYVIVSGRTTPFSIKLFDDNANVYTTTTIHFTCSFKISLLPLINGDILVGWVDLTEIYIAKYALNGNTFVEKEITRWGTKNCFISCVEMESNNAIVCQYVASSCDETYKVFTSDLVEKETKSIYKQSVCEFDKILYLGEDRVAATYLFSDSLYVKIYNHTNYSLTKTIDHTEIMNGCTVNAMRTDTTAFSNKKIIGTCISIDNYAQVAIVDVGITSVSSRSFKCSGQHADYPFASKFGDDFLSIFYHSSGNNVFEILGMPNCVGFEHRLLINTETQAFSMMKGTYIIQGSGDTSDVLNVIYPELPTEGKVYFVSNNTEIKANTIYAIPELKYVAGGRPGTFILKFAGTNSENRKGKWCKATFIVKPCYPIMGFPDSCVKDQPHYYINYADNPDGVWKPCYETCDTCSKDFTVDENNCDSCLTGYYLIEGDTTGKCTNKLPEGYYLDETDLNNKIYRKCYDTCSTCMNGGTQEDNQCVTCKENNYKFEDISGKCDSTDTSPNHNYYKDESDSTNIIWRKCYNTCASCSKGGDNTNNNCDSCEFGYKLIEGTNQCTDSLPEYHYENNTMYKRCNMACKTCNGEPLTTPKVSTNCIDCRTDLGYYPLYTDQSNCLNTAPEGYYKDISSTDIIYNKCYSSCKTCTTEGTALNNNCNECRIGYYPYDEVAGSCVHEPNGYYFDSTSSSYRQCNQACKNCNGESTSTTTNCITGQCADNFFPVENDLTNCLKDPPQYFLEQNSTPYLYKQCHSACNTCNGVGNVTDHKCIICKDNYKKIKDTTNCVNSVPQYYYETTTEYRPCYETCETCSADGNSNDHNCDTCRGNYKFLDGTKNCLSLPPEHHYLDTESDKYKPCDSSCDTCNEGGATNCQSCLYSSNYYPIASTIPPYQCYSTKPSDNYYLDTNAKEYKLCYSTCKTCSSGGNENDNNCDTCITNYYPYEGKPNSCVKDPQYYYLDGGVYKECYFSCKKCSKGGTWQKNNCNECKDGTIIQLDNTDNTYNCKPLCGDNKKFYETICTYCPEGTAVIGEYCINCKSLSKYKLQDNIVCNITSCNERQCVSIVPEGYYIADLSLNYYKKCSNNCRTCVDKSDKCLSCNEQYPHLYNNKCYPQCPDSLFFYNGDCIKCPYYLAEEKETNICINCNAQSMILDISKRKCISMNSEGYYMMENKTDNHSILYKCKYNCNIRFDDSIDFCHDETVQRYCSIPVEIDDNFYVFYSSYPEHSTDIINFKNEDKEKQIEIILELTESLNKISSDNIFESIQNIVYLNQLIQAFNDSIYYETYCQLTMNYFEKAFTLLNNISLTQKENAMLYYTYSLSLYNEIKVYSNYIDNNQISKLSNIGTFLIQNGINNFNSKEDLLYEYIRDDYITIIGNIGSILIEISNDKKHFDILYNEDLFNINETVRFNYSIQVTQSKTDLINYINSISLITSQLNITDISFKEVSFINVKLDNLDISSIYQKGKMISLHECDDYDKIIKQFDLYNLSFKLCLPQQDLRKHYSNSNGLSYIDYSHYPLLNPYLNNEIDSSFKSILIRNEKFGNMPILNLENEIKIIFKMNNFENTECLYYNETINYLDNRGCKSEVINNNILICSCNHLTDFSISQFNPVKLFKDIFHLFKQARIITSFEAFKILNFSNAKILYIILGIFSIYLILLFFTLKYELKHGNLLILFVQNDDNYSCCKKSEREAEINELKEKIQKKVQKEKKKLQKINSEKSNIKEKDSPDSFDITRDNKSSYKDSNITVNQLYKIEEDKEKQCDTHQKNKKKSCFYTFYLLFKTFFIKEYWFCTFINKEEEISKTNILTIFMIHLIASLTISSIFTECDNNEEDNGLFNNRDIAVSVATILILEIPFTIFEILLGKTKLSNKNTQTVGKYKNFTLVKHIAIYIIFLGIFIFGTINTTWISLDSLQNGLDCNFLTDFFMSTLFDCLIYQIIILFIKTLIYSFLVQSKKNSCFKGILLCIVSSLPWVFNLNG